MDPLDILSSSIIASDVRLRDELIRILKAAYRYEVFKPMMDLCATMVGEGRLKFVAQPKEFYALDEGHCITIEGGAFDKIANVFRRTKSYKITIKKITADVVIHEVGHMVEKESGIALDAKFMKAVYDDISVKHSGNISLNSAIKRVMVEEVKPYPSSQQASELFTRFFQLKAMCKEVAGYGAEYGYSIADVYKAFPNTNAWSAGRLYPALLPKIDENIAQQSAKHIKPIEEIVHKWSEEKVRSIHAPSGSQKSKWRSSVQSIDD